MMGAEGIKELLKKVDVEQLSEEIREHMKTEQSVQKKLKYAKRAARGGILPQVGEQAGSG